jgi:hypothetical protein
MVSMPVKPVLLIKKLGGVLLLLVGLLLTARGLSFGPEALTAVGILLVAGGTILLALKIVRRNQVEN